MLAYNLFQISNYNSYWKLNNSTLDNEYVKVSIQNEQNSAYFFQLENSHSKHTISHLNINGILTHEPRSIAAYFSSFYSSLYESRFNKNDTSDFLDSLINTKSISEDEK